MALLLSVLALAAPELPQIPRHQRALGPDPRTRVVAPYRAKLHRMARCESGGRWYIATGNGYYGGLQFDLRTWRSVGGVGYPHTNSKLEQMYRAVRLIRRRGYSPWPHCGFV